MNTRTFIFTPITNRDEAEQFQIKMAHADLMFHWEDSPGSIIKDDGTPLFNREECTALEARVAELFAAMPDPFALALTLNDAYDDATKTHGRVWRVESVTSGDREYHAKESIDECLERAFGVDVCERAHLLVVGERIDIKMGAYAYVVARLQ